MFSSVLPLPPKDLRASFNLSNGKLFRAFPLGSIFELNQVRIGVSLKAEPGFVSFARLIGRWPDYVPRQQPFCVIGDLFVDSALDQ